MKLKDLLIPMSFALLTTWFIQYMFFPASTDNRSDIVSDRTFVAPTSAQVVEPLDLEINFYGDKASQQKQILQVNTNYGVIEFSNYGAIIDRISYKRLLSGQESIIETVAPSPEKDKGAFLLALDGLASTPYYYILAGNTTKDDQTTVIYKGESEKANVTKEFTIYHDLYKIDLKVTVEPKNNSSVRTRIFFPAPLIPDPSSSDAISGVLYTEKKSIEKQPINKLAQIGKENPSIFGLEDHYFINALINDPQGFARRAYFKLEGTNSANAVLQSSSVNEKSSWNLSFYCGPKESDALSKVDNRLEGVLDYGWFAPISKLLLYILNFFYSIFKNYGIAIIMVTALIRLVMAPFTLKSEQSARKRLSAQKKLQYIEQKYKDDPQALAREKAEFIKKHGLSGTLGCLPLLLQLPIFIGLQRVLANAIELYKAPFGWILDLSARDPYYILPALTGVGMALQTTQTGDPRQRVANILIAIIIAAATSNLSAGLSLYICISTLFGLVQTYIQKALKI